MDSCWQPIHLNVQVYMSHHLKSEARHLSFIFATFFFDQFLCKPFFDPFIFKQLSFLIHFCKPFLSGSFCPRSFFLWQLFLKPFLLNRVRAFLPQDFSLQAFFLEAFSSQVFLLSSRPAPQRIGCNDHPRQAHLRSLCTGMLLESCLWQAFTFLNETR